MDLRVKASVLTVLGVSPSYQRVRFASHGEKHDASNPNREIPNKDNMSSGWA